MNRNRKHKSDRSIAVLTLGLMALGLIVIYAIGPMRARVMSTAYGVEYDDNYFFIHQLISVVMATVAFFIAFKFPYEKIRKVSKWLMVIGLGLCAVLAVASWAGLSIASCQLGGCRWFNLGAVGSFQPAEFLKLAMVLYLAQLVAKCKREGKLETRDFFQPFGIVCGLALLFVVVLQKDLGTGVSMIAIILAILFMSGMSAKRLGVVVGIILAAGVLSIVVSPHRMERLATFGKETDADSYHIDNAMLAIGTGGLTGVGIGNSVQATGYLPESINDSVFAVMGETFGFLGLTAIVVCFTTLLLRMVRVSERVDAEEGLVVIGVFAWVAAHVVVNIASMVGIVPLTGITLPLLSYGGTSMMFVAMGLGLTLQISCYTGREVRDESIDSGRRLRGARNASRRRSA